MAEPYSDEELERLKYSASTRARLMETCTRLLVERDEARRVAKVLARHIWRSVSVDEDSIAADFKAAMAYPERTP